MAAMRQMIEFSRNEIAIGPWHEPRNSSPAAFLEAITWGVKRALSSPGAHGWKVNQQLVNEFPGPTPQPNPRWLIRTMQCRFRQFLERNLQARDVGERFAGCCFGLCRGSWPRVLPVEMNDRSGNERRRNERYQDEQCLHDVFSNRFNDSLAVAAACARSATSRRTARSKTRSASASGG
jgi:hypothetical protein